MQLVSSERACPTLHRVRRFYPGRRSPAPTTLRVNRKVRRTGMDASVGCEDAQDLTADLGQALDIAHN